MTLGTETGLKTSRLQCARWTIRLIGFAFISIAIPSSIAAKPGSTGNRSTGSLGISLTVPSSVRAQYVQTRSTGSAPVAKNGNDYLCVNSQNPRGFRYFLFANSLQLDSASTQPLQLFKSTLKSPDDSTESGCRLTLRFDAVDTQQGRQAPLLLIISPE